MTATGYVGGDPSKVDRDGYTKGDVLAANTSGVLTAVPVGANTEVLTADSTDTEGVDWAPGGGSGGTPSNTVVTETTFGQSSAAGASTDYSRGDHTHGTPAAPSVPTASGSVVAETTFGQSTVVGVAATYSRGDHSHGTPALPTPATIGANEQLVVRGGYITTGDVSTNVGSSWTALGLAGMTVPAAVGDYVEFEFGFLNQAGNFLDAAIVVTGTPVIYMSNGTNMPAIEGAPWWYITAAGQYRTTTPPFAFTVTAPMISGGNVTVDIFANGSNSGQVFASTNYPLYWRAINYGAVL